MSPVYVNKTPPLTIDPHPTTHLWYTNPSRMTDAQILRQQIAQQAKQNLQDHVINAYYPRSIDEENGGFHELFDAQWKKKPNKIRSLVHQSRHIWTASAAAEIFPERKQELHDIAKHGLKQLKTKQADPENGAFHWQVTISGRPTIRSQEEKHAYGIAFAIYSLAQMANSFKNEEALELANQTFEWLDTKAHDTNNGGYFESLHTDGNPFIPSDSPIEHRLPAIIGVDRGYRTLNTHLHLLEALTALALVNPNETIKARVTELLEIFKTKITSPIGACHGMFTQDWQPLPDHNSYGHDVEAAFLLIEAAGACDDSDPTGTLDLATRIVDHTLAVAQEPTTGAFPNAGDAFGHIFDRTRVWWVQAEVLNALALLHHIYGEHTDRYLIHLTRTWQYVQKHHIDQDHKGWFPYLDHQETPTATIKSDSWTDPYHQTRALINLVKLT